MTYRIQTLIWMDWQRRRILEGFVPHLPILQRQLIAWIRFETRAQ